MDSPTSPVALPLQFQLLYNWEISARNDALLKNKTRMYPALQCKLDGIPIYRLIEYQFENHYVSAGQLWKACGLTITEGLLLFQLRSGYEMDFLVNNFPFCDIWVSVPKARSMAASLGVDVELSGLLDPDLDSIFSSDNTSRNELVHNWRAQCIPEAMYSTRALLETAFDKIEPLTMNRKIRTQISRHKQTGMVMKDRMENGMVHWQAWAHEQFLHLPDDKIETDDFDQSRTAVWDVLQGLLCDLRTLTRGGHQVKSSRVLSDNMMVGNMPLKREYLGQSRLLQNIYIAVMAEKIHNEIHNLANHQRRLQARCLTNISMHESGSDQRKDKESTSHGEENEVNQDNEKKRNTMLLSTDSELEEGMDPQMMLHDRMDAFEQELYRMRRRGRKKIEETQLRYQELQLRVNTLETWKANYEQSRKSERVWMLMLTVSIICAIVVFPAFRSLIIGYTRP
ncbi:uncharacterized protein BYT42DRAFT_550489 [Radiomyces spectabilis]|uniref:uncharacterized protein n=1 Tax=Radiomyces spectabilis TaxID=64574 RepID=UPI00221F28F4|nr:uncharacterized protein BYT42DRAFT_550489 [Radiomyces spectabilis]KAI8393261.1 hypothetical protein BYT42DRAFT_550489 [Radiomyces spectabilis]